MYPLLEGGDIPVSVQISENVSSESFSLRGEGGPKGRMRAEMRKDFRITALTRRFAAPSPRGRGILRKTGFRFVKSTEIHVARESATITALAILTVLPRRRGYPEFDFPFVFSCYNPPTINE